VRAEPLRQLTTRLLGACAAAWACFYGAAFAQDSEPQRDVLHIEVTGSNIRSPDSETPLPVQVITREDIQRGGWATVAELMSKLSANLRSFNDQMSIGTQLTLSRPGQSTVNLRGIGDGSTLVLIDGRRAANYAFDGGAVDVNSIPMSAIDRVEILKDGASAIYGADAIAGVVNFILRRDFTGAETSAYGTATGHGGGNQYQATATAGYGDPGKDRFNVFATFNYEKDEGLSAASRDFTRTGYRPDIGLFDFNFFSFPANVVGPAGLVNPAVASGCAPPRSFAIASGPDTIACGYDPQSLADISPPVERFNALGRATFQLTRDVSLFADLAYSHNRLALTLPPTAVSQAATFGVPVRYPEFGPFYPSAWAAANGVSGDLDLFLRTEALGNRLDIIDSDAVRAVAGADGVFAGWDYSTAVIFSSNTQTDDLARGYVSQQRLLQALATGLVNPFGPSGPEGNALLESSLVSGNYHTATGTTWLVDAKASRSLVHLTGGALALAVGAEARKEQLDNDFSALASSGDVLDIGQVASISGSRKAQAVYAEASVPFAKGWESQIAVRYDHYSDFGGTTNPKLALRWQPLSQIVFRSSWGTGFRAPTIYDLYVPLQQQGPGTPPELPDPVRCPVTHDPRDCGMGFTSFEGGNPHLEPETSEQFNAGAVWEPSPGSSLSIDYWKINKSNAIQPLTPELLFDNFARWAPTSVVRGLVDPAFPNLPGPIVAVLLRNENLGDLRTAGFDVDLKWRGRATSLGRLSFDLNGTYVTEYKLDFGTGQFSSGLGNNTVTGGPVPRWRHYASVTWSNGPWSATLAQTFQSGYGECNQLTLDPDTGACNGTRRVGTYEVWDVQGQYTGFKNTTVAVGIRNLFDRNPPFTQAGSGFSGGYDPVYADPRGVTCYARLTFSFK
jgi:iron complex outermembrane receptor protein